MHDPEIRIPRPRTGRFRAIPFLLGALGALAPAVRSLAAPGLIANDTFWRADSGQPIYSQGGGVFRFGGRYYWYGVKYAGAVAYLRDPSHPERRGARFVAVTCYSSSDLVHWAFERDVLTAATPGMEGAGWVGRLGVVFNPGTRRYVLITQYSGPRGRGDLFATCTDPAGAFAVDHVQGEIAKMVTGRTGDQTLFVDDDGSAYLICCNSQGRTHLYVCPLRPSDFLAIEPAVEIHVASGRGREGNCMFKYRGRYYFCSSDLHGWNASPCYVISASRILGPYGPESVMENTQLDFCHVTQTGFFVTVNGTAATSVLFCGDRWSDFAGNGLGYNDWCPISFRGGTPVFHSLSRFSFDAVTGLWAAAPGNNFILNPSYEADRVPQRELAGWSAAARPASACGNARGGRTGNWCLRQSGADGPYRAEVHQVVSGLPDGEYTLAVWYRSSGGQHVARVFARGFGGGERDRALDAPAGEWTRVAIPDIPVTGGRCEVGLLSEASAGQWVSVDDWSLTTQ